MRYVYLYCIQFAFIRCLYSYWYWISRRHLLVPATSQTSAREGVEVMDVNIRIPLNSFNWMHMSQKIGLTLYKLYTEFGICDKWSQTFQDPKKSCRFSSPKNVTRRWQRLIQWTCGKSTLGSLGNVFFGGEKPLLKLGLLHLWRIMINIH